MNLRGRRLARQGGMKETQDVMSLRCLSGDHSGDGVAHQSLALLGTGQRLIRNYSEVVLVKMQVSYNY